DIRTDTEVVTQQGGGLAHFPQDGAGAHQLHVVLAFLAGFFEQVHTTDDAFFHAFRHRRLGVGFVHHGDVVEDVFLVFHHLLAAVLNDDRQLIGIGRVITAAVGDGGGEDMAVAVLMLQAFTVERGAPGGATDQEALGAAVAGSPGQVADTLEAEHRIEDVERQHGLVVGAVGSRTGDPAGHGAGFVDAFVEDLALLVLAIEHHLVLVHRRVQLANRGVDAELTEHAFHAEGAGLVRHDRYDALAELLVLEHLREDAHERHGGGDFTLAGTVQHRFQCFQRRRRDGLAGHAALGHVTAQGFAAREQVFVLGASFLGAVEGQFFQLVVADRNAEGVPEYAQALGSHLLGVVGDVLALAGPGAVALDGLGQDDAGLTLVGGRGVVGSVHLVGIVAAAVELPDFLVGHVLDHLLQFRAGAEEVFADIGPVVGLVVLVVAVNGLFHALLQQAVVVAGQQRIPQAAPDDLDHVPVGAAEVAFQLLDDLAVTPYRAIQTLQVAVDDENQVVQLLPAGQGDGTQG